MWLIVIKTARYGLKSSFFVLILDQGTCSWVSGVHGPAGVWEEAWPDHHAQTTRYSRSSQETHQGTCRLFTTIVLDIFWSFDFFRRTKNAAVLPSFMCLNYIWLKGVTQHLFVLCSKKESYGYLFPTPSILPNRMQRTARVPLHPGSCVWRDDFLKT